MRLCGEQVCCWRPTPDAVASGRTMVQSRCRRRTGAGPPTCSTYREVLAWTASPRGIGGIAVRDLMLLAVERRFDTLAAPQPME
jgi:hypothetical protein